MANGVPRRSQKGRSIKRTCAQQAAQSEPMAPVDWRQLRQAGGNTVSAAARARLRKSGNARSTVAYRSKLERARKAGCVAIAAPLYGGPKASTSRVKISLTSEKGS